MVTCSVLTWLGTWWKGEFGWPSSHWLGHAHTLPSAHLKLNIQCKEMWRAWHTWRGQGSLPVPPCPPTGSCMYMHYRLTRVWRDVERPRSMTIAISKLNFKHVYLKLFVFFVIASTDFCLCTQLTMSISLLGLNIEFIYQIFVKLIPIHGLK